MLIYWRANRLSVLKKTKIQHNQNQIREHSTDRNPQQIIQSQCAMCVMHSLITHFQSKEMDETNEKQKQQKEKNKKKNWRNKINK